MKYINNIISESKIKALFILALINFIANTNYSQDLQKVIPSSSTGVLTLDGEYFLSKIDLPQILRLEMFHDLDERTQGRKGDKYNEYSKIYKAPEAIGVKINAKWYLFTHNTGDTTFYGTPQSFTVITLPLTSNKKFENFIKKVSDSSIVKSGSYKYTVTGYNQMVAWNKQQVLLILSSYWSDDNKTKLIQELNYLSDLKETETIKTNSNFHLAQSEKFDFNYWMNYNSMLSGFRLFRFQKIIPGISSIPGFSQDFYRESYLHINLNFNKGAVSFNAKQFLNSNAVKQSEPYYGKGVNPDLLKYFHKDHMLGFLSFSTNMRAIKSTLDTALNDTTKESINKEFIKMLYKGRINKSPEIKSINAELDSMYNDLYATQYDYSSVDTAAAVSYDSYEDVTYDTTAAPAVVDEPAKEEPAAAEEPAVTEEIISDTSATYDADYYAVDTVASPYDGNYRYDASSDSIYEAKNSRINELNTKKKTILEEYYKNKAKELGIKHTEFLEFFEGDFIIACTDVRFVPKKYKTYEYDEEEYKTKEVEKTKDEPVPSIVALMTLNNVSKAQIFLKKLTKDTFLTKQDNYYFINLGEEKLFIAIEGKILIISNDEALVTKNIKGYSKTDLISEEIQGLILNKQVSAYANLKSIFASMPYETLTPTKHAEYTILMNSFIDSHITGETFKNNISNSQWQINFTNKIDNSFYEIFRIFNEFYKISKNR